MENESLKLPAFLTIGAVLALSGAAAGAAFAGWLRFGDAIILTMIENGFSYCF